MAENGSQAVEVPRKLWEHPNPESTAMYHFLQDVNRKYGLNLKTFRDLHAWTLTHRNAFWSTLFHSANLLHSGTYSRAVDESQPIDAVPRWFEGVSLNFAENLLFSRNPTTGARETSPDKEDARVAVTEVREGGTGSGPGGKRRTATFGELRKRAGRVAAALRAKGVGKGDRVVLVGANSIDSLVVWLGTTWIGAVFSSSSTDMGTKGILQRAVQVNPKLLFMDDAAVYNGKVVDLRSKMAEVVAGLANCSNFQGVISIPRFEEPRDVSSVPRSWTWASFLSSAANSPTPDFVRIPFHEPMLICYSSGTTGMPKAIVHSVGGILINYFKEGVLHEGISRDTVSLQYTTTGWIMYLAAIGALIAGGHAVLYDGSPFQPDPTILVRLTGELGVTKLGISPRWMFELSKAGLRPRDIADLSRLRTVTSTGMVLSNQLFEWFYDAGFPPHVHLANISGGTDIAGCFGIMNPLEPVYVGGTQGPSLGIRVAVYDPAIPDGEPGRELPPGEPGELVAVDAFPNMPCFFWADADPSGAPQSPSVRVAAPGTKYHSAYFARFPHVWAHGDFCVVHPVTGSLTLLGRADGVLNPSGVRFGSAEIYGVIERRFADRVQDSLCVGQRRPTDADESVMLFVLMRPGYKFDQKLVAEIKQAIAKDLSKRHVPRWVFETPEIPTTINLKKVELPVKQIVSGHIIKPSGTLANPESLKFYYQFAKVEELVGPKEKL
ncbi:hypothetical protein VTJ04DRAFT_6212 [Mycothermus thermophilus]|uniref:uncharacterized protein n=1 Tax=Humicola insolens TaxID=85995 RepID=UPI0037431CA7